MYFWKTISGRKSYNYLLGQTSCTTSCNLLDKDPNESTDRILAFADAMAYRSLELVKFDIPTPTAYIVIPRSFAIRACRAVSAGEMDSPSVITTPICGTPGLLATPKISAIVFIPAAVFVPSRGCGSDMACPFRYSLSVDGSTIVAMELL